MTVYPVGGAVGLYPDGVAARPGGPVVEPLRVGGLLELRLVGLHLLVARLVSEGQGNTMLLK